MCDLFQYEMMMMMIFEILHLLFDKYDGRLMDEHIDHLESMMLMLILKKIQIK